MKNVMAWLMRIPTQELEFNVIPANCGICPCRKECDADDDTACDEIFYEWARTEYDPNLD